MSEFDLSGFLAVFFDEAGQRLQSINQKLVLFEAGELDEQGLIQLRRDAHTIKGSAQMLGVQDIGKAAHLFEDAIAYAVASAPAQRRPIIQFLFDLHDSLQRRLQDVDAGAQLDMESLVDAFNRFKEQAKQSEKGEQSQSKAPPLTKKVRKKKPRVPKNLIAAVMGSIEDSLQPVSGQSNDAEIKEHHVNADADADQQSAGENLPEPIDFRPELDSTGMELGQADPGSGNFLRVDQDRLSRLSNQIIELASGRYSETFPKQQLEQLVQGFSRLNESLPPASGQPQEMAWRAEFERQLRQLQHFNKSIHSQQRRSTMMLNDLRDQVLGLMLRPLNAVFSVFPRTVRDIGMRCGKKVQLLVAGDSVEMDQMAAEALTEPLIHLINNAVAHGIESPEERKRCGKPEHGQITITANRKGGAIEICVTDDGRGLDAGLIGDKAVEKGLLSAQEVADMDETEIMELIFLPGFSTCGEVSDIAGRGMGVTVVQNVMRELTGAIHIRSQKGKGSQFCLTIPVSIAVQQAVLIRIASQPFGILKHLVRQTLPFSTLDVKKGHGPYRYGYIDFEQHRVPIIDLHGSLPGDQCEQQGDSDAGEKDILIIEHLDSFLALVVDEVVDEQEILLREIPLYLKRYQPVGLMGCAIAADGDVLLLIDPNGLKQMWRSAPDPELKACGSGVFSHRMMLVDDSGIALSIEQTMFERMGFQVDTAIGLKNALEKIRLRDYDLLVTDLKMPEMGGLELIEQLRSDSRYQALPVLALLESGQQQQSALAAGANACMVKHQLNGDEQRLLSILSELLDTAGQSAPA